jgi:hypothetical protein
MNWARIDQSHPYESNVDAIKSGPYEDHRSPINLSMSIIHPAIYRPWRLIHHGYDLADCLDVV